MQGYGVDILQKKILLIDDERDILILLEKVMRKEGFQKIYSAQNGTEGINICKEVKPDIIVLDIMLPDMEGLEVCHKIREFNMCPILFLSAKSDEIDKLLGLAMGGDDYVTKPFSPIEIAYRLKAHLRRLEYHNPIVEMNKAKIIIQCNNIEIDEDKAEVKKTGQVIDLTAKEYQLLLFLVKNAGKLLSKNTLIENIWGDDYEGYENTLMVHIRHLREKIEEDPSTPKYIITFKGLGYKFVEED